jgi:hypothetical protein
MLVSGISVTEDAVPKTMGSSLVWYAEPTWSMYVLV